MMYCVEVKENNKVLGGLFGGVATILRSKDLDTNDGRELSFLSSKIERMLKTKSSKEVTFLSEEEYEKAEEFLQPIESILSDYDCELLVRTQNSVETLLSK